MSLARPGIIYLAVNRVNGKAYVGQTTTSARRRWREHINGGDRQVLDHAIGKHGAHLFDFAVLQKCSTRGELNQAEKEWIERLGSKSPNGYNISDGGGGTPGVPMSAARKEQMAALLRGKPSWNAGMKMGPEWMSEDRKRTLSATHKKRFAAGAIHPSLGRKQSDEERAKRSIRNRGINKGEANGMHGKTGELHPMHGKHHTEEANRKNREAHLALCADPEYRRKLSLAHAGKPWSAARRAAHEARKSR